MLNPNTTQKNNQFSPDQNKQYVTGVTTTPQLIQLSTDNSSLNDEIDLREIWRALKRRKKIVFVTAASIVVLTGFVTIYQRLFKPIYQGSFSLLISDPLSEEANRTGAAAAASGTMFEELARNTTNNDIPTLIEVLESPLLLSPIAKKFELKLPALRERISISTGGEKRKEAEGVLNVSMTGSNPDEDQRLLEALSQSYLRVALQQRQQRLADGLDFLNKQEPELQKKTTELQGDLAGFRERHNLLEPTEEGVALKQRTADLEAQVLGLEAERSRLSRVRSEIAAGKLSARGFQEAISTGAGNRGLNQQNQGLSVSDPDQSLLQQLLKVESELAEARSKYSPNSSMVQSLEARLNQLQPLLRENQLEAVDAALALNSGRLSTARAQQNALNKRFLIQPALIKQYETLQQRLTIARENLAGLVSARENFQLEIAQRSVPWRVIAPPIVDPNPIKPSVPRNLALGTLLGLVAGVGAALLRDRLDHVFHNPSEVIEDLKLPLLGHIPHVAFFEGVREEKRFLIQELDQNEPASRNSEEAKQDHYQRFFYQEAFRNLFTSIRFLNSDTPLRTVALTSSLPSEGKSLVNVLLAKTLSEMGQKVLLIDADLRKPQLHTRLGMNNLTGLSNLLTGEEQNWRQVIEEVKGYEGWSVITAGRRPPDPTRLLSSKRMHALVNELSKSGEFDLILFDTPPVLGLADAALVAEHCDGLMLLVSLNRVDRGLPKEAVSRIQNSGSPLLGIVSNSIKEEPKSRSRAYAYGQYGKYGYGYGYGYGAMGYATYAHYADPAQDESASKQANANPSNKPARLSKMMSSRRRQLMRWLDS